MKESIGMRVLAMVIVVTPLFGEVRVLTLRQVVETAMTMNPEVAVARMEERKAVSGIRVAKDAFVPKLVAGSGLAYSSGFPLSIEGSAPSIVEARGIASIFNRPQRLLVEKAKEDEKTARMTTAQRQEQAAWQAAALYLEAGRLAAAGRAARRQAESLEAVEGAVKARVEAGRELAIEAKRAGLRTAMARQRVRQLEAAAADAENQLAVVLALPVADRVRPAEEEPEIRAAAESEEAAAAAAMEASGEVRRLEAALAAKGLEMRSYEAAWMPRVDLVAQYGLFARFNNYDKFFNRFQRNNGQLGVSVQFPVFSGFASKAQRDIAASEMAALRLQAAAARHRAAAAARKAWQDVAALDLGVEVARMELDVAREQTGLVLALQGEGRASLRQVEEARHAENERWMGLFDAKYAADRARLDLLKETGRLAAALRP
jgi:outer membrane protein